MNRGALQLDIQREETPVEVPPPELFRRWAGAAYDLRDPAEAALLVASTDTIRRLNHRYRGIDRPTNVLAFPGQLEPVDGLLHLGDLVICAEVVAREAQAQGKTDSAHWAHVTIHGMLHLLGHDHREPDEAAAMESREIRLLASFNLPDPYAAMDDNQPPDRRVGGGRE